MTALSIPVHTDGSVCCGVVPWRFRRRLQLTVVVKAAFTVVPGGVAAPAGRTALVTEDRPTGGPRTRSVTLATDLAPYLARCDVLLTGYAYAPGGVPAHAASTRLAVARDGQMLLDKTIHVYGDRGPGGAPQPFLRFPLVWERAFGGLGEANPSGTGTPNLVDARDARRPACFGPISRAWPSRRRMLSRRDRKAIELPVADLPETMPWGYFQAAPRDQQIDHLRGDEWFVLDGMHPTLARVQTRLPRARVAARVFTRQPGAAPVEHAVELACDTLAIDADQQVFTLSWRGRYEVAGGDALLPHLVVAAAPETPGVPVDWARILASAPQQPAALEDRLLGGGTIPLWPRPVSRPAAPGAPVSAPLLAGGGTVMMGTPRSVTGDPPVVPPPIELPPARPPRRRG